MSMKRRIVLGIIASLLTVSCGSGGHLNRRTIDGQECVVLTNRFNNPEGVSCNWNR